MLVSTKGRYALRAVVDIAENSRVDRVRSVPLQSARAYLINTLKPSSNPWS